MKKQFLILFAFISVLALSQVPQRFNKVIVTGDITSPKFIKTGSTADSVLLGNGSARAISTVKTDTVSLSNRINAKATGNGTANGTNTGDETLSSIKTKLGAATAVSDGYLKYQDYVKFDGKLSSEVDGSTTNELQTISTTGAAGNITLSNSGGTLNLNVNDADASTTNEIQDLSLSGNTLSLSSDATTVDISQATAVLANTAKVSNATHTGDATGSTALTLATVNSNVGTFNNVTINAKGLATAGSNVGYLTGITSGQVTTALGYTPKLTFTENTGFNKNFGTTTGTVLEGRTFGTAANSAVGDFIQNQNSSEQTASMWITGTISSSRPNETFRSVNSTNNAYSTRFKNNGGDVYFGIENSGGDFFGASPFESVIYSPSNNLFIKTPIAKFTGSATFYSTVNSTGFLLNGNNLTSSLTANYIPKWNGSSFVNSNAGTDYQLPITLTTNGTSGAATFSGNVLNVPNYGSGIVSTTSGTYTPTQTIVANINSGTLQSNGVVYTKVGNIYTISMSGSFTSTSSGSSQIDISLPEAASSFVGSFLAVSTTSDGGQNRVAWVATSGNGGTFIRLWTSPTSSESIKYYITGQYVSQ